MPMYEYECECGFRDCVYRPMAQSADSPPKCEDCGRAMHRDYRAEGAGPHLDKEFHTPIQMHSIALCNEEDIEAFKRRNPDAEIGTDPNREDYGVPKAWTRREKLKILEKEGFVERN